MTQEFLQDAIVEDLKQLFSHYTLTNSLGALKLLITLKKFKRPLLPKKNVLMLHSQVVCHY